MIIYDYCRDTGALLKSREAREDPLEPGRFLIPAYATTIVPPEVGPEELPVFSGGAWHIVTVSQMKQALRSPEEIRFAQIEEAVCVLVECLANGGPVPQYLQDAVAKHREEQETCAENKL